ncbi:MAG: hypothetical protein ACE5J2_03255 [Nitrososphaerales archaeon]
MSELLEIKKLYGMLVTEIENDSVQYIQPNTYRDIADMLGNMKGQGYDGIEARIKDSLTQLITDIATVLLDARLNKIRSSKSIDYTNLTEEERYIVAAEKDRRLRSEQVLSATVNGRTKALELIALKAKTMQVLVRFLKALEAMTGVDNSRYGPYQQEDVAVLPFENAKTLIERGVAIELPWTEDQ